MPAYIGSQLALELSNIVPGKELVQDAGAHLLTLARDLRKSGSDLIVEEDLAGVFGRGRISSELEKSFKDIVRVQKFIPLSGGCEIELVSGPGPTLSNASKINGTWPRSFSFPFSLGCISENSLRPCLPHR